MRHDRKFFLNSLIDKYENSKLSKEETKRNLKISFNFNKSSLSVYFNESDYEKIDLINQECLFLQNKNFINIDWKNEFIINRINLNLEVIDDIYIYLNRNKKTNLEEQTILLLLPYTKRDDLIGRFTFDMVSRLKEHKSIKSYLNIERPKEINDLIHAMMHVLNQDIEILKRKFSILIFKDSKRFEQLENRVVKILHDYKFEDLDDTDDILAEYNIISNPSYVYLKGNVCFKVNNETIDLKKMDAEIALNTNVINLVEIISLNASKVITIENLTSFYDYEVKDELVIYLGGYHNRVRRNLLKKIHQFNSNMNFYHWGDIDFGGFQILNHLRNKTKIDFKPHLMDLSTLMKYESYAMPISKFYLSQLTKLLNKGEYKEFHEIIEYMIDKQIRLEQEIVCNNRFVIQ